MKIATSPKTHWRYEIVAIRCLRTLLRRDVPLTSVQIRYFLERTHHTHPSVVSQPDHPTIPHIAHQKYSVMYVFVPSQGHALTSSKYAQRGVMKSLRNVKLRTLCSNPVDLFLGRSRNPLKEDIRVEASHALTSRYLQAYKAVFNLYEKNRLVHLVS